MASTPLKMHAGLADLLLTRKNVLLSAWLVFLLSLGFNSVTQIIPYYIMYLEGTLSDLPENLGKLSGASGVALEVGLVVSLFNLSRASLARFFGGLSDRRGRKRLISIGSILYAIISSLFPLVKSLPEIYALRAAQGAVSAMVWPAVLALIMDTTEREWRGRAMAVFTLANNSAMVLGPAIAAGIYKLGVIFLKLRDVRAALIFPFVGLAALSYLAVPPAILLSEPPRVDAGRGNRPRGGGPVDRSLRRSLLALYTMGLANGFSMGFAAPLVTLYVAEYINADPAVVASVPLAAGALAFLATYPAGRVSDSVGRRPLIIWGSLVSRVSTAAMPFVRNLFSFTGLYSIRAVSFSFASPSFRAIQGDIAPSEIRGRVIGTIQTMYNVGAVVGPVVGGQVYSSLAGGRVGGGGLPEIPGEAVPFLISSAIGLFSIAVFAAFVREPGDHDPGSSPPPDS